MRTHARLVIVGAGIVGCSAAYHLTQMGWSDILVLDKGPLFETGGSTTHALAAAFESAIREADRLADLLRADTERATNLEATRQRIADMQTETQRNEERRSQLAGKRQDLQRRWESIIAPLRRTDLSPAALREWLSRHQRLVERHGNLDSLRTEWASVDGDITR